MKWQNDEYKLGEKLQLMMLSRLDWIGLDLSVSFMPKWESDNVSKRSNDNEFQNGFDNVNPIGIWI